jgi:hypothetical protein
MHNNMLLKLHCPNYPSTARSTFSYGVHVNVPASDSRHLLCARLLVFHFGALGASVPLRARLAARPPSARPRRRPRSLPRTQAHTNWRARLCSRASTHSKSSLLNAHPDPLLTDRLPLPGFRRLSFALHSISRARAPGCVTRQRRASGHLHARRREVAMRRAAMSRCPHCCPLWPHPASL